uniref:Uncharacterized protein n=1 Tax=Elaeophora elaphi TaxID=1147741 RepID=A0A0R3RL60_9BILA
MEKAENLTPEKSKCRKPDPPPHQSTFTSAPQCPLECLCEARQKRNEAYQEIRDWLIKRNAKKKSSANRDSGIHSESASDDELDKENRHP